MPTTADPKPPSATTAELTDDGELEEDELLVEDDVLVEEVSIDGMCGVY
jgi:mycofactocin precursor